jgi:hypothetical protein
LKAVVRLGALPECRYGRGADEPPVASAPVNDYLDHLQFSSLLPNALLN